MSSHQNSLGQPIGRPITDWAQCPYPPRTIMQGRYCSLEPLEISKHAKALYDAYANDQNQANWTYLFSSPFKNYNDFLSWFKKTCNNKDQLFYAVIDSKTQLAIGTASYLRINPKMGVIEVGHIHFSPLLQKTALSTETMYLMMRRVFDELGYRRYEWKCDSLNAPSNAAAKRLGFSFEGVFRQAIIYKGRNRDTAWYSIIDSEWPALKVAFEGWLDPDNFDNQGQQLSTLASFKK